MNSGVDLRRQACGYVRGYRVTPTGLWTPTTDLRKNDLLADAAVIMAKLLRNAPDGQWAIGGMYIEFDNSGSDVDPVPTIDVTAGRSYYDALNSGDPNRDYLRVPLVASASDSSDTDKYPLGNQARFWAQTSGATGVHGNTFSAGANSLVYGGALVSFVDGDDAAQDLLWARFYFPVGQQISKMASSQVGITWEYSFGE